MDQITDDLIQSILRVEHYEKNIKLIDYKINYNAADYGNNISSEVSRLYVNYEKDGKIIEKTYFVKIPSKSPLYAILKHIGIYEKECLMYTTILPEMSKLVPEEESLSPKSYVISDSTVLILEDLRESGYKMIDSRAQMDFEHASAAIRALAKFHALSLKINETQPEKLNTVKRDCFFTPENGHISEQSYKRFLNAVESIPEIRHLHSKLSHFKDHYWNAMLDGIRPRSNALNVLNHGDFLSNNMLFNIKNEAVKVKLVDFHLCRWCSPTIDISFMFMTSVRFEVFENKRDSLLEIYHDTFTYWLNFLECREKYTLDDLKADFQSKYVFGLSTIAGALPLVFKKPVDLNSSKAVDSEECVNVNELVEMYSEEKYRNAITKWMLFYEQNGLIPAV